ncbi:Eco57I restriction-modification methylase domain-containing protein [Methylomicrobium album]|uniref:Eco57I restriction-modification methylase domain-containing protein n=1 Tax=Methylomicrobium album TaxID=39775 RepID=UPI00020D8ED5|nr:N-6 DNA methylase [Methylomicrobium album]
MNYPSIRIEGAILSPDILEGLHDDTLGQRPADFGLESGLKVKDEIARAWADAQDYWRIFQRKLDTLKTDSPATTETRNLWMVPLLGLLGYQLEYQPKAAELNGKTYAISHRVINRAHTPLHIIGCREPAGLDKKPERTHIGTPRMSAHGLVQEYLNLHDELYGIVTNGRVLRLLRDSSRLVKLTYLEFDLDRIFTDGLFADFAILYRLLHATRLPISHDTAAESLLELYHQDSLEQGTRIRDGLRKTVTEALEILGTGFLSHSKNEVLQQMVKEDHLRPDVYFNYLLRLVYRLLFVMVIEERGVVFPIEAEPRFIGIYFQFYSVQRLRRLAITRGLKTERFQDAWASLLSTFQLFEKPEQAAKFGMTALGGKLFHPESLGPLSTSYLSNATLFSALDRLCYFDDPKTGQRTPVNFGALATEEFGSVYESLLELHPQIEILPTFSFGFLKAAGNERKTSGSYYTPTSLVDCLLESTLDPVIETRIKNYAELGFTSAEKGLLAIKVCDPACGSGHFLIAAAQRIARRLALLRSNGDEPAPDVMRHSLREVIGHCIFGVDINPMSVELCKLGLWLEAVEPGKPLTFLDHHIKCGNSLLGATPAAIKGGIPDEAYKPLTADSKEAVNWMKKLNKDATVGQGDLFEFISEDASPNIGDLTDVVTKLENLSDETVEALQVKENLYKEIVQGNSYDNARLLHDAWCAAFVWPKDKIEIGKELTTQHLRDIERDAFSISHWTKKKIRQLAEEYRFFHWHLEYPSVFGENSEGGFDCVLGNPPWERVKLQEKEFFAERSPEIANAINAASRKRLIA